MSLRIATLLTSTKRCLSIVIKPDSGLFKTKIHLSCLGLPTAESGIATEANKDG